jgi:FkbM family methyltransferase
MRLEDIADYYKLRKVCENPSQVLRFRKVKDKSKHLTVKFKDGYKIFIQAGTDQYHTFHRVFLRDEYQISQCAQEKMKCVVDLGANVGYFSTRIAALAEKVICYEPIASNVEKIKMNRDGRKNIEIVNKAVAGKKGFIKMFKPHAESWSCRYSMIFHEYSKSESEFEPVECITLDELFEEHRIETCDLMKMDIEGAEYETLYNTNNNTFKKISRIVGEYHFIDKDNKENNIQSLKTYLTNNGYRVETMPNKRKDNVGLFFCEKT